MGLIYNSALCFLTLIVYCNAKLIPIVYEDFEMCTKEGEDAGKFDFSQLEILAESDTSVYLNGSWKFAKEVKSPWTAIIFAEKYIKSEWVVERLSKKIPDFCEVIQGPNEPWYYVTQHFEHKECPFPAGVSLSWCFVVELEILKLFHRPKSNLICNR
jgi:hypothetical protein